MIKTRPSKTAYERGEDLQELINELKSPDCAMNWIFFDDIKNDDCDSTKAALIKLERMKADILKDHELEKWVFNHNNGHLADSLIKFADGHFYSKYLHSKTDHSEEYYKTAEGYEIFNDWHKCYVVISASDAAKYINSWVEITEADYWYSLEVLPPMQWHRGNNQSFFCMEATTADIHACYISTGDKYYSASRRRCMSHGELMIDLRKQLEA